jgi:hypothetical protein
MNSKHVRGDADLGEVFQIGNAEIFVNDYTVGRVGGHPSGVDYYYSERGYGCKSAQEVAEQYYRDFCEPA